MAALLLLVFWAQAAGNLSDQSPVVDEPTHIVRGQAYWRTGDFRLQRGHPPLIHALTGLVLQLEPGLPSPADLPGWAEVDRMSVARHFLWDAGRLADRMIFLARLPVLMQTLCLGALLFRWANQRLGAWPALGALFLFAFDPNLLAHSVLVTTDMGVTVFIFLAAYALDQWMIRQGWLQSIGTGVALGLALTSKFSAVILGPVVITLAGLVAWRRRVLKPILGALVAMGVSALVVIGVVYWFEFGPLERGAGWVPLSSFWRGLLTVMEHNEAGHPAFLFGRISPHGWWYYFIIAFLLKTPLPTLLLLIASLSLWVVRLLLLIFRPSSFGRKASATIRRATAGCPLSSISPVWVVLLTLYFLASLRISINVGYRHVLPLVPFVILLGVSQIPHFSYHLSRIPALSEAGGTYPCPAATAVPARGVLWMWKRSRRNVSRITYHVSRFTLYVLLVWYIIGAVLIYPYHLAYFNELVGGPDGGYRALVDSNLDWGQDVKRLKRYLDALSIEQPYLTMFAGSLPEDYGIRSRPLPGPYQSPTDFGFHRLQPVPGVYVIGASNLQGLRLEDPDTFDTFRRQTPVARVGHTLFVYRVDERPALEEWVAVCYTIDGPMDGEDVDQAFGRNDLRKLFYDCRRGWIYPSGGAPGWYIVPLKEGRSVQAARFLLDAPLVFHERGYAGQDAYNVHRFDSRQALEARLTGLNWLPQVVHVGPATFLGYTLDQASAQRGETIHVVSYWQADESGEPLLSILAHLGGPGGLVATGDGLAVPAEMWRVGDVIAQVHTFEIPPDTPSGNYTIYLGMYSIVSGQREPASLDGQPVADGRLPIAIVYVRE